MADSLPTVSLPDFRPTTTRAVLPVPSVPGASRLAEQRSRLAQRLHYPPSHSRRRDFTVAVVTAILLHAGALYGDRLFRSSQLPAPPKHAELAVLQMEMPPLEPEPPEVVHDLQSESAPGEPAPPMLPDLPTVVPINAFVEPMTPPALVTTIGNGLRTVPLDPPGDPFGHGTGLIFDVGSVDVAPQARNKFLPAYPAEMRRENATGEVEVEFVIDAHGRVTQVSILRSTHPAFEAPVLTALRSWSFRPGRKGGRDVNTRVRQTVTFNPATP